MSKLFQKIKSVFSGLKPTSLSYARRGMKPVHDWKIILIASQIAVLVVVVISVYFYVNISQGKLFSVKEDYSDIEININNNLLKKIVDDVDSRQSLIESVKENKTYTSDPSL